ncbi:MAG: MFS transporter [Pirellulales bacterium]
MPPTESDASPPDDPPPAHDAYAVIRLPNFRRYWLGNLVSVLGMQMQSVTVGWEIYQRTGKVFYLGLIGLVQVIPVFSLALIAGHVADRLDRKRVLMAALALSGLASLGLAAVSYFQLPVAGMFVCLFLVGVARSFLQPAKSSFLPQLVPRSIFSNAVTWSLGAFQLASVAGPALAGASVYALGYVQIYLAQATAALFFITMLARVQRADGQAPHEAPTLKQLGEGVSFVWNNQVVLGAMALDMFAVLLGGATALLPVFAKEVLHIGSLGFGFLAAAQSVGALSMSLFLVYRPPLAHAGRALLWSVAGFGLAIIVFGLSRSFMLSFVALAAAGACDCVSVVVRHSLVQMLTPDRMRGRVSAISSMFISASNELGEFESGTLASLTSPIIAVVAGGAGTIMVVITAALRLPQLRRFGPLDFKAEQEAAPHGAIAGAPLVEPEEPAEVGR